VALVSVGLSSCSEGLAHLGPASVVGSTRGAQSSLKSRAIAPRPPTIVPVSSFPNSRVDRNWAHIVQGLAHDDDSWYVTAAYTIARIPVAQTLDSDAREMLRVFPQPAPLSRSEPGHLGAPAWADCVLFVPELDARGGRAHRSILQVDTCGPMRVLARVDLAAIDESLDPSFVAFDPRSERLFVNARFDDVDRLAALARHCPRRHAACTLTREPSRDLHLHERSGDTFRANAVQAAAFSSEGTLFLANSPSEFGSDGLQALFVFEPDGTLSRTLSQTAHDVNLGGGLLGDASTLPEAEGIAFWDLDDGRAPGMRGQLHLLLAAPRSWPDVHSDAGVVTHYAIDPIDRARL
jgi:hypothetical protein